MAHCVWAGGDLVGEDGVRLGQGNRASVGEAAGRRACCVGCRGGGTVSGKERLVSGRL